MMNENPKISVIVTTWKCEPWLEECRDSIRVAVERLVEVESRSRRADGGVETPPATLELELATRTIDEVEGGTDIEVLEICDGAGVAHARNAGIAKARGEWLFFVDGDDVVMPDCFVEILRRIGQADLLTFRSAIFHDEEKERRYLGKVRPFPSDWLACAYSRRVLPEGGFQDFQMGEDRLFLLQCMKRAKRVVDADILIHGYRQHADSTVGRRVTMSRFVARMAAARAWLRESEDIRSEIGWKGADGERNWRQEIRRARRIVAKDLIGAPAVELQKLDGDGWPEWWKNMDALLANPKIVPGLAFTQARICRGLKWRWVTRLVAEWPRRILSHYGL